MKYKIGDVVRIKTLKEFMKDKKIGLFLCGPVVEVSKKEWNTSSDKKKFFIQKRPVNNYLPLVSSMYKYFGAVGKIFEVIYHGHYSVSFSKEEHIQVWEEWMFSTAFEDMAKLIDHE